MVEVAGSPPGRLPAVERSIQRDVDGFRGRLQRQRRNRHHAMARGRHPRLLGTVLLDSQTWTMAAYGRRGARRPYAVQMSMRRSSGDRAFLHRRDGQIETTYEVAVVPDADAEVLKIVKWTRAR